MDSEDTTTVEYFVTAILDEKNSSFEWLPDTFQGSVSFREGDREGKVRHTLVLKRATIGPDAKEGELNVIEMVTKGIEGEEVRAPLAYLQMGSMYQTPLDLVLPDFVVLLKLIKGKGPVHVLGQHIVTAPVAEDDDEVDEDEEAGIEECEDEMNQTAAKVDGLVNDKKRKSEADTNGDVKKVKLGENEKAENGNGTKAKEGAAESIEVDAPAAESK